MAYSKKIGVLFSVLIKLLGKVTSPSLISTWPLELANHIFNIFSGKYSSRMLFKSFISNNKTKTKSKSQSLIFFHLYILFFQLTNFNFNLSIIISA
ncbi:hypothetical protein HOG21_00700 [bacterium]|nr:hypothetical protein [bacterium]